jgi:hypothetical protein
LKNRKINGGAFRSSSISISRIGHLNFSSIQQVSLSCLFLFKMRSSVLVLICKTQEAVWTCMPVFSCHRFRLWEQV